MPVAVAGGGFIRRLCLAFKMSETISKPGRSAFLLPGLPMPAVEKIVWRRGRRQPQDAERLRQQRRRGGGDDGEGSNAGGGGLCI